MGRKGRPVKTGKRHPNGRLVHTPTFDRGTERVQAMKAMFGTFYASAAGRMFASGLMGEQDEALGRYQGLQRFVRVYKRVYGGPAYRCPLDQTPKGIDHDHDDHEQCERDREWIRAAMASLDMSGCYPYMEQIICVTTADAGPAWLDRLIDVRHWNNNLGNLNKQMREHARQNGREFVPLTGKLSDPRDQMIADAVCKALDILAPAKRTGAIVSQQWEHAA